MKPNAGDVIQGKYRIVRLIGDGGMGSVYEARHEYLGTNVALKFLHPELARRPGLVTRFLREGQVAASIKSPHIAQVLDVDRTANGSAFLVMELLAGESLQQLLERSSRLPLEVALDYTLQILAGLEVAHAAGVVHRDLKPDNVFVVSAPGGPLVKVLDFGIAKLHQAGGLTRPGALMGTPEYMAPEQADSADRVDMRADLFAVGAMLYEMLSGQRPTQGGDARQIAAMIRAHGILPLQQLEPTVPAALAAAIHRALAADPAHRFASVADLRAAILPFCGTLSPAGRLAATPAPPLVSATPPPVVQGAAAFPPAKVPSTLPPETPPPASRKAPKTWPDDPAQQGYGSTAAMPVFVPPGAASPHREATRPMPAFAPAAPQPPPYAMHPAPMPAPRPAPPRRRKSGLSIGLLAAGAGACLALLVIAALAIRSSSKGEEPLPTIPTAPAAVAPVPPAPPPAPTPTIIPPSPSPKPNAVPASPSPAPRPSPAPAPKAPEADAGAVADAGDRPPPRSLPTAIPLPSGLPPGFPKEIPLPEGLPPLPIPIPGWSPPPASSTL